MRRLRRCTIPLSGHSLSGTRSAAPAVNGIEIERSAPGLYPRRPRRDVGHTWNDCTGRRHRRRTAPRALHGPDRAVVRGRRCVRRMALGEPIVGRSRDRPDRHLDRMGAGRQSCDATVGELAEGNRAFANDENLRRWVYSGCRRRLYDLGRRGGLGVGPPADFGARTVRHYGCAFRSTSAADKPIR